MRAIGRATWTLLATLDNLIAAHRLPPMAAIGVGSGGQDAQGAERVLPRAGGKRACG